jgi:hypothetical protein
MIPLIQNDHSARWHSDRFAEFAAAKAMIGEPTPHMNLVTEMSRGLPEEERVWRAGCYLTAYSVLTGEAIWREWPWKKVRAEPEGIEPWLRANWGGIHTRRPRRCVRTPPNFARSLLGFAEWAATQRIALQGREFATPHEQYDAWWESTNSMPFYGRYISIRLLELLRRWGHLTADLYDIRAVGAHSPIRCLMLLSPTDVGILSSGDVEVVNAVSEAIRHRLGLEDMSFFTWATLLCEYRAGYEGGGDYAGNQHDEELEYTLSKYAKFWEARGFRSGVWDARARVDHPECLGEVQGWSKRRLDIAGWLRDRGFVWSDMTHDYLRSQEVGEPVSR